MGKRCRRVIALGLALLFLSACSTVPPVARPDDTPAKPTDPAKPSSHTFTLAYSRSDSLDPYKMTSRVNRELGGLLYEGLTVMDAAMQPQNALAESVQVDGQSVIATLRKDAVFSNGSAVTAADVVTSFAAAKACEAYAALLKGVREATADEEARTVTFTLNKPDPFAAACLIFPVVRAGADGAVLGSGRYMFDPAPRLVANPHGAGTAIAEIRLLDLVNDEERAGGVEVGSVTYFFSDLSGGTIPRVSGGLAAVPMNYLVFLGVNSAHSALAKTEVRAAVSAAIDRTRAAESAFAGYAEAATAPFHPLFLQGKGVAVPAATADRAAAMQKLAEAGFAVPNAAQPPPKELKPLALNLLVCEDNGFKTALATYIQEQLAAVGITVTVVPLSFQDYTVALRHGRYDLYIGEVRLAANMDLSPLLTKSGAASFGVSSQSKAAEAYADFCAGEMPPDAFCTAFAADLPYIPLCWRKGLAAYNRALTNVNPTAFQVYAGLENWKLTN